MIPDEAVEAAHRAICEDDLDDCLEWRGRCVKAVEAAAPYLALTKQQRRYPTRPTAKPIMYFDPGCA